ncbi:MAG: flagellar export protein FliJ [Bacillota bacterium]|nr:flagellar export protein FliJ [Bacillota bacterium]
MSRFRFRLERLLDLRRQERQAAELALGLAMRREEEAAERCRRLESTLAAARRRWAEERTGTLSGTWRQHAAWLEELERLLGEARSRQQEAAAQAEAARAQLAAARTGERSLERLRERRLLAWRLEEQRSEQRELDEVARLRWLRRHQEGGEPA